MHQPFWYLNCKEFQTHAWEALKSYAQMGGGGASANSLNTLQKTDYTSKRIFGVISLLVSPPEPPLKVGCWRLRLTGFKQDLSSPSFSVQWILVDFVESTINLILIVVVMGSGVCFLDISWQNKANDINFPFSSYYSSLTHTKEIISNNWFIRLVINHPLI